MDESTTHEPEPITDEGTRLIAAEPADYFRLPRQRTITLGSEIEF